MVSQGKFSRPWGVCPSRLALGGTRHPRTKSPKTRCPAVPVPPVGAITGRPATPFGICFCANTRILTPLARLELLELPVAGSGRGGV